MAKLNSKSSTQVAMDSQRWECEDDFRTLQRAEEIKNDPKCMMRLKTFAKEKLQETANVAAIVQTATK